MRQVVADADRPQHVRRFDCRRRAGRPRRNRDVVDRHQQRLALDIREADIQIVRQTLVHRAVDVNLRHGRVELCVQAIAKLTHTAGFGVHLLAAQFCGFAEPDDARDVERA